MQRNQLIAMWSLGDIQKSGMHFKCIFIRSLKSCVTRWLWGSHTQLLSSLEVNDLQTVVFVNFAGFFVCFNGKEGTTLGNNACIKQSHVDIVNKMTIAFICHLCAASMTVFIWISYIAPCDLCAFYVLFLFFFGFVIVPVEICHVLKLGWFGKCFMRAHCVQRNIFFVSSFKIIINTVDEMRWTWILFLRSPFSFDLERFLYFINVSNKKRSHKTNNSLPTNHHNETVLNRVLFLHRMQIAYPHGPLIDLSVFIVSISFYHSFTWGFLVFDSDITDL